MYVGGILLIIGNISREVTGWKFKVLTIVVPSYSFIRAIKHICREITGETIGNIIFILHYLSVDFNK